MAADPIDLVLSRIDTLVKKTDAKKLPVNFRRKTGKLKRIRKLILGHLDAGGWRWNKGLSDILDSIESILFKMRERTE